MPITIAPQTPPSDFELSLASMTDEEAVQVCIDLLMGVDYQDFQNGAYDVRFISKPQRKGLDSISFSIMATREGVPVNVSNPITIKRPPIKAFNGTYHEETVEGETFNSPNYEINPEVALQQIIIQLLSRIN